MPVGIEDFYQSETACWVESDSSKVYFHFTKHSGSATATVKAWGVMPSNVNVAVPIPPHESSTFINTRDFNYSKLIMADRVTVSEGINRIVDHRLGYIPEMLAWAELANGRITPLNNTTAQSSVISAQYILIGPLSMFLDLSPATYHGSTVVALHYRFYGEENG